MADGCVYKQRQLRLNAKTTDVEIFKFVNKELSSEVPIRNLSRLHKANGKIYQSILLVFNSKEICENLNSLGIISNKSGKEKFVNINPELLPDFIRGYFDGDGYVGKYNYNGKIICKVDIVSGSKLLCEQFKDYFGFGRVVDCKNCFRYIISSKPDIIKFGNIIYNNNFCLNRKYLKYLEIKDC